MNLLSCVIRSASLFPQPIAHTVNSSLTKKKKKDSLKALKGYWLWFVGQFKPNSLVAHIVVCIWTSFTDLKREKTGRGSLFQCFSV